MRAAVVGAGFVGAIHARALAAHPDVELVAVCGRTAPKTDRLAAVHGVAAHLSVESMMRACRPELVCVATGNRDHAQPTVDALAGGAHVLCEKPLAFRLDEARAMVAAAERHGRRLGTNFNHRFAEPFRRALAFVRSEELGPAAYVDVKFAGTLYKELDHPQAMMIETQGHSFDLMRLFAGEIEEVSAFLTDPRGVGVATSAAVAVRFASGAVGTLLGSWDGSYDHPAAQLFEYSAVGGGVVVENIVDRVALRRNDRQERVEWQPRLFETRERDFWQTIDAHVHAFVDALARDAAPPVSGVDGLRALELTFAAIESAADRRPVRTAAA